jgi:hypothetical protein
MSCQLFSIRLSQNKNIELTTSYFTNFSHQIIMKTLKTILTLLMFALLIISCSSDDDEVEPAAIIAEPVVNKAEPVIYKEENPLDAYLAGSGFNQTTYYFKNQGSWVFGFSFKPAVIGKINSIIVKIPDVNTALTVTLWDVATKKPIRSEVVNVPTANVTVEKTIAPIALIKDKEYLISVNSDDWISRRKTDASATIYPIVAGNITITGYAVAPRSPKESIIFPTNVFDSEYDGDLTFKFQQTE